MATKPESHPAASIDDPSKQYEIPAPEPFTSFEALKARIRLHYELASDYYYSLWGEHIHHGYFLDPSDSKEKAQVQLIQLLLQRSGLPKESSVLDVGCGIGGTSRYLALNHACAVTGITISGHQVQLAQRLSIQAASSSNGTTSNTVKPPPAPLLPPTPTPTLSTAVQTERIPLGDGSVSFLELDAEKMGTHFEIGGADFEEGKKEGKRFDAVWISEALSHFPDKALFFRNAAGLAGKGGKVIVADWFKRTDPPLSEAELQKDIKPIEDGMLLPPLSTAADYVRMAETAGLSVLAEPLDISQQVKKTWEISISLVASPSLWALALSQGGRDGLAFLHAFLAMRRGFANGSFRYAVLVFEKK